MYYIHQFKLLRLGADVAGPELCNLLAEPELCNLLAHSIKEAHTPKHTSHTYALHVILL